MEEHKSIINKTLWESLWELKENDELHNPLINCYGSISIHWLNEKIWFMFV